MKKITDKSNNLLAIVIDYESIDKEKNFVTDNSSDIQLASFNLKKKYNNRKSLSSKTG